MIPITAGILSGVSAGGMSRRRTAQLTLTYAAGLALFYALLGLLAGLTGSLFGTVSANPWARFAIGNLAVRTGQVLDINGQTGEIANASIPAEYTRPEYRAGWSV